MKYFFSITRLPFALLLALIAHSCKEEPPTGPNAPTALALSVVDSTCIDIELKLASENPNGQRLVVERQTANQTPVVIFDASLNKPDTSILDTGLLPNTPYTYRAYRMTNNTKTDPSPDLLARTMDTTSHNWTWTMETFGDFASSAFYDVAIINDTLAYAVGQIYLRDSLGQNDPTPYNLAIWNGQSWRFERVLHIYQGNPLFSPLTSIFAFNENDIWLGAGGGLFRKNGQHWQVMLPGISVFPASPVNKIWGQSSSDLYIVGNNGNIAHYNGFEWRRIESGTSLDIHDIYGGMARDGSPEILAVASNVIQNNGSKLFKLEEFLVRPLNTSGLPWSLTGLWFASSRGYYVVGDGIYTKRKLTDSVWQPIHGALTSFYTGSIYGKESNNMFCVGSFMEVLHFNGATWKSYRDQIPIQGGAHTGVYVSKNIVLISGYSGRVATLTIGRRSVEEGGRDGK